MKIIKVNCWFGAQAKIVNIKCRLETTEDEAIKFCMERLAKNGIQSASVHGVYDYIEPDFTI